jgi:uncharacterized protein YcbX
MTHATLAQINIYPVKSLGGFSATSAKVEPRGLQHDRRWMLVDGEGRFLTQRDLPRMALIATAVEQDCLTLRAPGVAPLRVPLQPPCGATETVRVWRSVCQAVWVGDEADQWLREFFGVPCRLVFMPEETRRTVNPDFRAGEGIVSFADGYPLLLLGEESLFDLNSRLEQPVPMNRFRPNLVVSGAAAYAEDGWTKVRIGGATFHGVKLCDRCSLITVDQATGEAAGPEPLKTLAAYRLKDQKVLFGQLLIPDGTGTVQVGDAVETL